MLTAELHDGSVAMVTSSLFTLIKVWLQRKLLYFGFWSALANKRKGQKENVIAKNKEIKLLCKCNYTILQFL